MSSSSDGAVIRSRKSKPCSSCKSRRLKCDESKPTCMQCQKRGLECVVSSRNLRWKFFDGQSLKNTKSNTKVSTNGNTTYRKASNNSEASTPESASEETYPPSLSTLFITPPETSPVYSYDVSNGQNEDEIIAPIPSPKHFIDSTTSLNEFYIKKTTSILSLGFSNENNPWISMILPMAETSTALQYAIRSMTAFHMNTTIRDRNRRMEGIEYMRKSLRFLSYSIRNEEEAIGSVATSLVLSLGEAWDTHVRSGIAHLRGSRALFRHLFSKSNSFVNDSAIKFLYNTWMYFDVLARLTDSDADHDIPIENAPMPDDGRVDPLLGISSSLFVIIDRVAILLAKVRRTNVISHDLYHEGKCLELELLHWKPNRIDPKVKASPTFKELNNTANAYRLATLVLLYQTVTELSDKDNSELADRILIFLAEIPATSTTLIVHIFPMMVASCEVSSAEQRRFAELRWEQMGRYMTIGNLYKAVEVIKEVWFRKGLLASKGSSVKDPTHWLHIMKERNWEILLG